MLTLAQLQEAAAILQVSVDWSNWIQIKDGFAGRTSTVWYRNPTGPVLVPLTDPVTFSDAKINPNNYSWTKPIGVFQYTS